MYCCICCPWSAESDEYWSSPATAWTCKKGWEGVDLEVDKALKK